MAERRPHDVDRTHLTMQRRKLLTVIGSTAAATTLAGCTGEEPDTSGDSGGTTEGPLVIRSHRLVESEYGNVSVVGRAENVSDRVLAYAQIEASFLDGNTRVGSGLANISDLQPGRVWEFEAMYLGMDGDRITNYELTVTP